MEGSYNDLPPDLPVPRDDGAADHLEGTAWPELTLDLVPEGELRFPEAFGDLGVLFIYPRTGTPGIPLPTGWDEIPGARGCTPQNCAYRGAFKEFEELDATLFGLSSQTKAEQTEFSARESLPYPLLNDRQLRLHDKLGLPTFEVDGIVLYRRLTLIVQNRQIAKVFYPVFPPDRDAATVLDWLRSAGIDR